MVERVYTNEGIEEVTVVGTEDGYVRIKLWPRLYSAGIELVVDREVAKRLEEALKRRSG